MLGKIKELSEVSISHLSSVIYIFSREYRVISSFLGLTHCVLYILKYPSLHLYSHFAGELLFTSFIGVFSVSHSSSQAIISEFSGMVP